MKVLVTGGAGYVGSTLVPLLLGEGHSVRVLDSLLHGGEGLLGVWGHPEFAFQHGDIRDASHRKRALEGVDGLVHLAAIVGDPACARQPDLATAVNLEASAALFRDAGRAGVKRGVFASTCSNYGRMADAEAYADEETALAPVSHYAETKVAVEQLLLEGEHNGMCVTPLRFATVYGVSPRMRFDLTVNEFTMEMIVRRRLVVFGEQFWRPYIHVADAARAIVRVLEAEAGRVDRRVFNAGVTEENYRKADLVEMIRGQAAEAAVEYVERLEDPRDYRVCFERIRTELGFAARRNVRSGIEEVARLVRSRAIPDPHAARYRN